MVKSSCGAIFMAFLLSGCANTFGGVDKHRIPGWGTAISQPANVRSAYIKGEKLCAEPPPDAALQAIANATAKVSTKSGTEAEVAGGLQTSIVQLAGRTQVVLIARDAFTANCMLAMNGFITPADAQTNFGLTLDVIKMIARADEKSAEAAATSAKTEAVKTAILAKSTSDPAVAELVSSMLDTSSKGAAAVAARFTAKDGSFLSDDLAKFSKDAAVVSLLGASGAKTLGAANSKEKLIFLLTHSYMDEAGALGDLVKKF